MSGICSIVAYELFLVYVYVLCVVSCHSHSFSLILTHSLSFSLTAPQGGREPRTLLCSICSILLYMCTILIYIYIYIYIYTIYIGHIPYYAIYVAQYCAHMLLIRREGGSQGPRAHARDARGRGPVPGAGPGTRRHARLCRAYPRRIRRVQERAQVRRHAGRIGTRAAYCGRRSGRRRHTRSWRRVLRARTPCFTCLLKHALVLYLPAKAHCGAYRAL
jgi:hypothetical protein